MKTRLNFLIPIIITMVALSACSDNKDNIIGEPNLLKLGEFTDNGVTVVAYAEKPLHIGYNEIYIEVHEDGVRFPHPHIHFTPMMHMANHSHASPYDEPGHDREKKHDLYKAWAIFTMPSGEMGTWELQVTIHDHDHSGFEVKGIIPIVVSPSNRVSTFMLEDESRYVFTWILPESPKTGLNDLKVALHKRESMMNFPPVLNMDMDFEPWMPSMDHGSANNVAPVHNGNGFYEGQVNFNMTGDWELRFTLHFENESRELVFELDF